MTQGFDVPRRRKTDNIPFSQRPTTILYSILIMIALGVLAVVFSGITAANLSESTADSSANAALAATRNQVDLLENRLRTEEGHACITRYMRDVVHAFASNLDPNVVPTCGDSDTERIQAQLRAALNRLEKLDPNDVRLEEVPDD